jgi:hypothetical protein
VPVTKPGSPGGGAPGNVDGRADMQTELSKVIAALREFYARETYLLEKDCGERTLTHRLAVYVESQFSGWEIDCDYNRLGERTLRMPRASMVSTDDEFGKSIFPDIVVHQREIPNNLLAIEVRKASNHQPLEHDQQKLRSLTDPHLWFAYRIGVLVSLATNQVATSEVYTSGALDQPLSRWLSQHLEDLGLAK